MVDRLKPLQGLLRLLTCRLLVVEEYSNTIKEFLFKEHKKAEENQKEFMSPKDYFSNTEKYRKEFINFLGENAVPFTIVFTKIDRQSAGKTEENLEVYKQELLKYWEELPNIILTSAEKRKGLEELLDSIKNIIPYYTAQ